MLVLRRIHVVAELVGCEPELGLEADVGGGVPGGRLGLARHGTENSFVVPESSWCNSGFGTEVGELGRRFDPSNRSQTRETRFCRRQREPSRGAQDPESLDLARCRTCAAQGFCRAAAFCFRRSCRRAQIPGRDGDATPSSRSAMLAAMRPKPTSHECTPMPTNICLRPFVKVRGRSWAIRASRGSRFRAWTGRAARAGVEASGRCRATRDRARGACGRSLPVA